MLLNTVFFLSMCEVIGQIYKLLLLLILAATPPPDKLSQYILLDKVVSCLTHGCHNIITM